MSQREFISSPDTAALSRAAAQCLADEAGRAIADHGCFRLVLSGGSTPEKLYKELTDNWTDRIPWDRTEIFWGDERVVSPDDSRSNFGQAQIHLLSHVSVTEDRIFPMFREGEAANAARDYETVVRERVPGTMPAFDLIILGIGADGHTASLFPGSETVQEQKQLVRAVPAPDHIAPHVPRITMTLPLINAGRTILFLAAGAAKSNIINAVQKETGTGNANLPASMVSGHHRTLWFVSGD